MAINFRWVDHTESSTALSTISQSLSSTPDSGDLIVVLVGAQRADRDVTAVEDQNNDSFTKIQDYNGANFQPLGDLWYKISDGDETQVDVTLASTVRGAIAVAVFSGVDQTSPLEASNEDETNVATNVTSQGTGSATAVQADGLAFYGVSIQNAQTWDGGFACDTGTVIAEPGTSAYGGVGVSYEIYSSAGAKSATFSTTDTGNEAYGCVAVFKAAAVPTGSFRLVIPDPRWEEPRLLIPGAKPTGPVTIDWDHPLTRGLKACYMAGLQDANLVTKQPIPHTIATSGAGLQFPGTSGNYIDTGEQHPLGTGGNFSAAWIGDCSGTGYPFVARVGSNMHWGLYIDNGKFGANVWASASRSSTTDTSVGVRAYSGDATGGTGSFYLNGVADGTATAATSSGTLQNAYIGGRGDNTGLIAGYAEACFYWDRQLSASEHEAFGRDPYCFVIPQ